MVGSEFGIKNMKVWIHAPCHKAQIISDWFLEHDNEFTLLKWPPQSPDLSLIEHLWDVVEREIRIMDVQPTNVQQLRDAIMSIWTKISEECFKHLVESMPRRIKGIVHPKMKILSSLAHPQVVPNLYECLCSAEYKGRYSEECGKQSSSGAPLTSIVLCFPTMEVNGAPKQPGYKLSSKYLPLCSAEQRNSYRFGNT